MGVHFWWYLSRGAGIACWLCAAIAVAWGLSLSSKATLSPRPNWQLAIHRHLGMLTITALCTHIIAIVLDGFTSFGLADVTVPFHSHWRRVAIATGVIAMWILVTVETTSLLKNRLPKRVWAMVHRTSLLAYLLSTAHFLQAGSEASNRLIRLVVLGCTAGNLVLLTFRILADGRMPKSRTPRKADSSAKMHA
jgi:predicted ferric reductase